MSLPSYELELRASEQRKRIHYSLNELKTRFHQKAALKPVFRKCLAHAAVATLFFGLLTGYGVAGLFVSHK